MAGSGRARGLAGSGGPLGRRGGEGGGRAAGPLGRGGGPGGGARGRRDRVPRAGRGRGWRGLVEPQERGDPMSPLRWTVKSTRKLAAELTGQGHKVGADTVGDLLRQEGFSLQANAKTVEGKQHADRDAQFRYISEQARARQDAGEPVVSVDTKKKELAAAYNNSGRE